ncbi:MAG: FtsX-like permease family protein, partial [Leptolyngbya sp. SIO1D8]|nr:FtsX-like permease family protein [Leptolyngbya sp. SIO1D8]
MEKDKNKTVTPPEWPLNFLEWFCPAYLYEGIAGDLIEKFGADVTTIGLKRARRNFFFAVIRFFRPSIILRNKISTNLINIIMLRSYLRSAFRNVWNNKSTSFINVLGFSLGMVCVLIIAMVIRYELSFDSFHSEAERIFRLVRVSQVEGQTEYRTGVPYALPDALEEEIPSLKKVTAMSYHRNAQVNVLDDDGSTLEKFQEKDGCAFVDELFFDVFDFKGTGVKWLTGDKKSALSDPYTVVLTRSFAEKYFQSTDVVGKTLKLEKMLDLKVTGVVEDLPLNTDLPFKLLISYATLRKFGGNRDMNNWSSISDVNQCYVVLSKRVSIDDIERQIAQLHAANVSKQLSETRSYFLQPLSEVHSDFRYGNYNLRVVTSESIWTLGVIGCFLLVMVCINFVNLSTALAITRSKEVGIRKVLGSTRRQVVALSMIETTLTILIALLIAMFTGTFILEKIQELTGLERSIVLYRDPFVWIFSLSLAIVIIFLAGLYPALVLSNYKPVLAIKKNLNTRLRGGFQLRRILLIIQFCIMQVLIIATFITVRQMHFFKNVNMGFSKEAIINVEVPETGEDKLAAFRNDLLSFSSIGRVSFSSSLPSGLRRARWFRDMRRKGADQRENLVYEYQSVDHHYLELYDIKLLAGRNFTEADSNDNIIINQTLSAKLGFASPDAAINHQVRAMERSVTIIGVTQDFYTNSFKEDYDKVALTVAPWGYR